MSCESSAKNFRSSYVVLRVPGVELTIPKYQGDFGASGLRESQAELVAYTSQGENHTVRKGPRVDPSGSFTCHFSEFSSIDRDSVIDFVRREGKYAGNASSPAVCGDAYLIDIDHVIRGDGTAKDEVVTYSGCGVSCDYSSGDPDSLSVSWTCYGQVTPTRRLP